MTIRVVLGEDNVLVREGVRALLDSYEDIEVVAVAQDAPTLMASCSKPRFQADDMVKRFLASGRSGFYLAVTREGDVGVGDEFQLLARDPNAVPVSEITRLYIAKQYSDHDASSIQRALKVAALPDSWKDYFRDRLQRRYVDL